MGPHVMVPWSSTAIHQIDAKIDQSFLQHKKTEKRTGELTCTHSLKDAGMVITRMLYVLTPSATRGWCLGAGTYPPTRLKNPPGTPSARVTIARGTGFLASDFYVRVS